MSLELPKNPSRVQSIGLFLLGGLLGSALVYSLDHLTSLQATDSVLEKRAVSEKRVWPLLGCFHPHSSFQDLNLKDAVEAPLQELSKEKNVSISVFTKSYPDGFWYGYNENASFKMGSLFKVISLINYLHQSEANAKILDEKIKFDDPDLIRYYDAQGYEPKEKMKLGETYSIRQLLERMIIYSDNVASVLLEKRDNKLSFKNLAVQLDTPIYEGVAPFRPITIKEFSNFFQILFNGTFLNRENSEWALELLTKADFQGGIRSVVPENIPISHKFGEAYIDGIHYFNHCGIVYQPQNPFLLCLSIQGKNEADLISAAKTVAELVYQAHQSHQLASRQ